MNYSKIFFGKDLNNLTYQDIISFFSEEREESNTIEFKGYSLEYGNFLKNIDGVIRSICAMLNSEGGVVIWGAPEGQTIEGKKDKIFVGELSPVKEIKSKDWIINKVSDLITPLPIGINVNILTDTNNYIYVFEIQQSTYRPHQFKNSYFVRLDGQTKPAPHYLIEALFKQITYPNIEGYIKPNLISHDGISYFLDFEIFLINWSELQNEENAFFRLVCPQGVFTRYGDIRYNNMYDMKGHMLIFKDEIDILHFGAPNIHYEKLKFHPSTQEVDLILMFAGKKSPLKTSKYKLNLKLIDWNNENNPNYLIISAEENIMNAEGQHNLGMTREDTLKNLLGR